MFKRQLLLLSSSKIHGHEFLEFAASDICDLLKDNSVSKVLFVPYALSDHDAYLRKVEVPFKKWGYTVIGIHRGNPIEAVEKAEAIFVGGGNTFRLLKCLYDLNLIKAISKRVLNDGIPYIGSSADMLKRQLLLLSSLKIHGHEFLEFAASDICDLLNDNSVSKVLFVPYGLSDHDAYLRKVEVPFTKWGYTLIGIHRGNPIEAVEKAEAIFVGGGNTFRLLKCLYDLNLIKAISKRVLNAGIPYIGVSAGSNIATRSINTTNDMPIVYPPTFKALNFVPFNINPHYLDPDPNSKHKGETREERILQYLEEEDACPVLGLREGSTLYVKNTTIILKGIRGAKLFIKDQPPQEVEVGSDLSYLLTDENTKL